MVQLIGELFAKAFDNEWLRRGDDGAVLPAPGAGERLVVATTPTWSRRCSSRRRHRQSCRAWHVNDVAMMGARPLYLAASFILEEGFPLADLSPHRRQHGRRG